MRTFAVSVFLTAAIISAGCGATRKVSNTVAPGAAITSAKRAEVRGLADIFLDLHAPS